MMTNRSGIVYFKDIMAGTINETDDGYAFEYLPQYLASTDAEPISLTLPLSKQKYKSTVLFSFFDGLIPEGWLLQIASSVWKIPLYDRMGLLLNLCHDCIGAVSIIKNGDRQND